MVLLIQLFLTATMVSAQESGKTAAGKPVEISSGNVAERNYVNILADKVFAGEVEGYFKERFQINLYKEYPTFPRYLYSEKNVDSKTLYKKRLAEWLGSNEQFLNRFK